MYRVLLVDDEILVREAISENIHWEELGYEFIGSCQNGKEAIGCLENSRVDVVLTDICMPHMDGMKLSEYIYKNCPETTIIIFSGFDDFEYAKKAIKYKVEEYLLKPVTAFELSEVLNNLKEKMDKKKEKELKLDRLNKTYNKNKIFIQSKVLADFIMGSKTEEENRKALLEANIILNVANYKVAVIDIDLYSDLHEADENTIQQSSLMAFAVFNISDEIIRHYDAGIVCQGNNNRIYILFQIDRSRKFKPRVKDICIEISKHVEKFINLGITIGIGRNVINKKNIYKSYEEAKDSINYRYLLGEGSIIDMEEIVEKIKKDIAIDDKIDALVMAVKLNDKREMNVRLEQIQETIKQALVDKNRCNLCLQQIVIAISETLRVSDLLGSKLYIIKNELLSDIANSKMLNEAMKLLREYCLQVAIELEIQKNTGGKKHALLALDYIEKHYADSELNLNTICSYISISASRFSAIFKNATGETFMEVLIRTRMQKAKELLENTDLKNYEIAEKVGFSDPHYFSTSFKKMTGKTPTEYAKEKR